MSSKDTLTESTVKLLDKDPEVQALVKLLSRTGLRVSEALGIRIEDITEDLFIEIKGKKGSESRLIDLSLIEEYVKRKKRERQGLLFTINYRRFYRYCKAKGYVIAGKRGQNNKVTHSFRHVLISKLNKSGVKLETIQKNIGHKRAKNTELYAKGDKKLLKGEKGHTRES
jgi:integrase